VTDELTRFDIAPTVSPDSLTRLRDTELAAFHARSIVSIGRKLGAKQVLYLDLQGVGVGVSPGSEMLKGVASCNVRLIEVETGRTFFPPDAADGLPLAFETRVQRPSTTVTPAGVRAQALEGLATRVGRLFRKWRPDEDSIAREPDVP
jgi:hypothetical protein